MPSEAGKRVVGGLWGEYSSSSGRRGDSKAWAESDHSGHNLSRAVMGPGWLPSRAESSLNKSNDENDTM